MICMSLKMEFNVVPTYRPTSSKWSLSPRFFHEKQFVTLLFPICAMCPLLLILVDLVTQIVSVTVKFYNKTKELAKL